MMLSSEDETDFPAQNDIRKPAAAGLFYPDDPQNLTEMIDGFLSTTKTVIQEKIGGLVSPHAGYVYSGSVAAWSYQQISGKKYDVVVVIAPSHFESFTGASIYSGKYYETPLGEIVVDRILAQRISQRDKNIRLSEDGHGIRFMGQGEHSLEVQLPFLQKILGEFKLVPIVIADQSWRNTKALAAALADSLGNKKALLIASSDLSHYHAYQTAYHLDKGLLDFFEAFDYEGIIKGCESYHIEACGYGAIATMMYACSLLGYKKSKVIKYSTSGDVPIGEKTKVVGYMSGAVYK